VIKTLQVIVPLKRTIFETDGEEDAGMVLVLMMRSSWEGSGNRGQTRSDTYGAPRRHECEWGWRRTCQVAGLKAIEDWDFPPNFHASDLTEAC